MTRKFSPGLITALALFIPVSIKAFNTATSSGVPVKQILLSILAGFLLMAYPIILIKTKGLAIFKQ